MGVIVVARGGVPITPEVSKPRNAKVAVEAEKPKDNTTPQFAEEFLPIGRQIPGDVIPPEKITKVLEDVIPPEKQADLGKMAIVVGLVVVLVWLIFRRKR